MRRYTFVVQVHPEGVSTLENLSTAERVRVEELGQVGPQIERWLAGTGPTPSQPSGAAPGSPAQPSGTA